MTTDPGTPTGLRERKKQQTRARIEDAALRLFLARGIDGTTVEEIADAAGVAPRTFFRYFAGKDAVLADLDAQRRDWVRAAVAARPRTEDPLTAFRRAIRTLIRAGVKAEGTERMRLVIRGSTRLRPDASRHAWAEALTAEFATRLHAGPAMLPGLLARVALAAVETALQAWTDADQDADPLQLIDEAFDLLERVAPDRTS